MIRATTPTHKFELGINISNLEKVLITYKQNHRNVMDKTLDDCKITAPDTLEYTLTQEEMNEFCKEDGLVTVQVRILTKDGTALSSQMIYTDLKNVLNDEVL